jgi:hypothetical protein
MLLLLLLLLLPSQAVADARGAAPAVTCTMLLTPKRCCCCCCCCPRRLWQTREVLHQCLINPQLSVRQALLDTDSYLDVQVRLVPALCYPAVPQP